MSDRQNYSLIFEPTFLMKPSLKQSISNHFIFYLIGLQVIGWIAFIALGRENIFFLLNGCGGRAVDFVFFLFTLLGEWPLIVFAIIFVWFRYKSQILNICIAFVMNAIISFSLKNYVFTQTPRPAKFFIDTPSSVHFSPYLSVKYWQSFPSGHTFTAFTGLFFIALLVNKPWCYSLCFILALLAGISRIYNGMHFPEDVLAGALIGVINTLLIIQLIPPLSLTSHKKTFYS